MQGGYGAYNAYISAATRYGALGAPTLYDQPTFYGSKLTDSWILHTVLFLKCKLVSLPLFMM